MGDPARNLSSVSVLPHARYKAGEQSPYHLPPPHSFSEDSELAQAYPILRDWARHLAANSSVAVAVLESRRTNGIGSGLMYEPLVRDRSGDLISELNTKIRRFLKDWRKSPDVTGELSGSELERLAWRSWDMDGEIFLRKVIRREPTGIPYRVQLIESDMVPYSFMGDRRQIVQGVAKDGWGRPQTYYVHPRRPSDPLGDPFYSLSTELVPIPGASMHHLKHMVRPDQTRGLTLLHAVIFRTADIAEYAQSQRLAARGSADLFASINRSADWEPPIDEEGRPTDPRNWNFEHLQMIDGLGPGEMVNFHAPQHPNQNAPEFLHEEMRQIAAGTRSGFSQIAQVFDRSFAAQRLETVHVWRNVEAERAQFIDDLALPALYEAPLRWAIDMGLISIPRKADPDTIFDVRIDGPTMPVIDPVKDREAFELDQENGWDARHGIMRKLGRNPADVDAERKQDDFKTQRDQGNMQPRVATPPEREEGDQNGED